MGVGDEALSSGLLRNSPGTPRVSVVIPVRNRRDLLRRTLEALAAQTLQDHEVIVVDDGSTDGSIEVAMAHAADDPRVQVVSGDGNGAVGARTAGVRMATASILAFTDSDCSPDPKWLEAGVAAIERGIDVVQGRTEPARSVRPLERSVWSIRDDGLFATCNVFYRRAAFEAAGGFDGTAGDRLGFRPGTRLRGYGFGEDTLVGWRVRRSGRASFASDALVAHAVFPPDIRDAFTRAWTMGAFPGLVREVPELRALMAEDLRRGLLRRLPVYAIAVGCLFRHRATIMGATALWAGARWRELSRTEPSLSRRAKVLPVELGLDLTHAIALFWGSVRSRTPVL